MLNESLLGSIHSFLFAVGNPMDSSVTFFLESPIRLSVVLFADKVVLSVLLFHRQKPHFS